MANELRTQGTELWMLDPDAVVGEEIVKIGNVTGYGEFGKQSNDIVVSNLDSTAVEKLAGLPDNGDLGLTVNVDPTSAAHQLLEDLAGTDARRTFCIGYSDGTTAPTFVDPNLTAPTARTSQTFLASVKAFRQSVGLDSVVSANVSLGISGAMVRTWKT